MVSLEDRVREGCVTSKGRLTIFATIVKFRVFFLSIM